MRYNLRMNKFLKEALTAICFLILFNLLNFRCKDIKDVDEVVGIVTEQGLYENGKRYRIGKKQLYQKRANRDSLETLYIIINDEIYTLGLDQAIEKGLAIKYNTTSIHLILLDQEITFKKDSNNHITELKAYY